MGKDRIVSPSENSDEEAGTPSKSKSKSKSESECEDTKPKSHSKSDKGKRPSKSRRHSSSGSSEEDSYSDSESQSESDHSESESGETDMWNKRPEFTAWLAEVKQINLESLPNWEEKQLFKDFMEDHNTATFPSKKYYNLDAYYKRQMEKESKKGVKKVLQAERTVFNDEEQRRQEMLMVREKQKEEEVEALKRAMQSGMAQAMKEQAQLREEMAYLYKIGNFEAAAAIQKRLDPDVAIYRSALSFYIDWQQGEFILEVYYYCEALRNAEKQKLRFFFKAMGTRGVIGDKWSMRILWACAIGSAVGLYMVAVERQQQNRDRMLAESLKAMESEGGGE
ncbi:hypothetical protein V6N11_052271 [Hibiscus sabdariffa]|uniref:Uncharacterized protein n=1 Tax=Hibiscus sabdariffa TaxID=183260 RepID=A0ABR2U9J3_9ROSI